MTLFLRPNCSKYTSIQLINQGFFWVFRPSLTEEVRRFLSLPATVPNCTLWSLKVASNDPEL